MPEVFLDSPGPSSHGIASQDDAELGSSFGINVFLGGDAKVLRALEAVINLGEGQRIPTVMHDVLSFVHLLHDMEAVEADP